MQKRILVVALDRRTEALRMAAGLTLLDDQVTVKVCGPLDTDADEQLEALDFADVPVDHADLSRDEDINELAQSIAIADAVYVL
ncbi:MAG: hypothetical protein AB7U81_04825 [Thiohalomonadaceae bacterium]